MICAFVIFSESLIISGCRTKDLNPTARTTEFMSAHLNFSEKQTSATNWKFICWKKKLLDLQKTINNEIIAQMKSETADASKLEALLNKNIEKLRL